MFEKEGVEVKAIGAVTIGKLIEAHYEKDEHKFKSYAEFIAEAYKERGEERAERIIRSKIDGTYKNKPVVGFDEVMELERRIASQRGTIRVYNNKLKSRLEQVERLKQENKELREKNAELTCQMKRNTFCYSCKNATDRCFRNEIGCPCEKYKDENAELKEPLVEVEE